MRLCLVTFQMSFPEDVNILQSWGRMEAEERRNSLANLTALMRLRTNLTSSLGTSWNQLEAALGNTEREVILGIFELLEGDKRIPMSKDCSEGPEVALRHN